MPLRITITEDGERLPRALPARDQRILEAAILSRLQHQPAAPTKAIKRLRPNPLAESELRAGDLRALHNVEGDEVVVLVVGRKVGNRLIAVEMVIDCMHDHNGDWPADWDSLRPYFDESNGRVGGWSYAKFQSHIFIDFDADANRLRELSIESDSVPFDVIHARSIWGAQFEGGPNEILYWHFRDADPDR